MNNNYDYTFICLLYLCIVLFICMYCILHQERMTFVSYISGNVVANNYWSYYFVDFIFLLS